MAKKMNMQSLPNVAVIYARYSSHSQKDASIEQQVEKCTAYAVSAGLKITETYADRAVSGKTDRRTSFQRMMRDAEKGLFRIVIAWKSNRIGRNMLQAMMNEAKLSDLGIKVLYTEEDFDDTAAGRFALRSMMNVNQFYSENMAEDIIRGLYDNASKCKVANGGLPLGYKKGEDGRFALDPPNDDVVREIFTRVASGELLVDIARDLNARGIKTSRGNEWVVNSFHVLLTNQRYTGVYIYGDVRIEDGVPQIVGKELFLKVQDVLKHKKNPRGRHRVNGDYLLTGKLFCGKCKSYMIGMSGTGKGGTSHYCYICHKKRTERSCDKAAVQRDWIEKEVAAAVKNHILQLDTIEWIAKSTVEYEKGYNEDLNLENLESQLSDNKRATKNLLAAIEQGIITSTTKDRLMELEKEQAELSNKIVLEKASQFTATYDDVVAWLSSFREGDITDKEYQAQLIDSFLSAVYLYDDKIKIVFGYTGPVDKNSIEISIDNIDFENEVECSSKVCVSPPQRANMNHA